MKLKNPMLVVADIDYVHSVKEHSWGQRVVRIYDPDKHIIEIGEDMKVVCKRFLDSGMTPEQVAERMDVSIKFVNACICSIPICRTIHKTCIYSNNQLLCRISQ